MLNILDTIQEWIMEILKECIMGNLNGLFDSELSHFVSLPIAINPTKQIGQHPLPLFFIAVMREN